MADGHSASAFWDTLVFQATFEPPGDAQPEETRAGGSRRMDRCQPDEPPIQVLSPEGNYGLTQAERPELFIQLQGTSAAQIVLTFQDETGSEYQRSTIPVTDEVELMSLRLASDTLPLTVGRNYQWTISVMCDRFLGPRDPIFTGWVQRTERIRLLTDTPDDSPQNQAEQLADSGYWYDLLSLLARTPGDAMTVQTAVPETTTNNDSSASLEVEEKINPYPVQAFWQNYLNQITENVANETD